MRLRPASLAVTALTVLTACGGGASFSAGTSATAGFETVHGVLGSPGTANDKRFGAAVAWIDWNDDGRLDMAVGMPGAKGPGVATEAGLVALYLQSGAGTFSAVPDRTFVASNWAATPRIQGAVFGETLAVGDFDGDGLDDLAIGAPGDPAGAASGAGRVYLLFNTADVGHTGLAVGPFADPAGPVTNAFFGAALAAGRMGADLPYDLAVGAPGTTLMAIGGIGRVTVFQGNGSAAAFGTVSTRSIFSPTAVAGTGFGAALAVGDVRGDTKDELIVGAPGGGTGDGEVNVYEVDASFTFSNVQTRLPSGLSGTAIEFGASLALLDIGGDGDLDLAVGAPFADAGVVVEAGVVDLLLNTGGTLTSTGAPLSDPTPESGARFGDALIGGEVNGDARDDLVVAAPDADVGATIGAGHVVAFIGGGPDFVSTDAGDVYAAAGVVVNGAFGASLDLADVDGDGYGDLLVGAPGPSAALSAIAGSVEILFGRP
mgnify:CR=1 FL=1